MRHPHATKRGIGRAVLVIAVAFFLVVVPAVRAQETAFTFDPAATKVEFTLGATLHTVHGTMKLKSGEIRFDPVTGKANGEVVVDATSAETGNKSRDNKMHKEVLRSARYPAIVFTAQQVAGSIQPTGASQLQLSGLLQLDARQRPMTLTVSVDRESPAGAVSATAKFPVPYPQWGLKNPSTLFLRVSDHVEVKIDAMGQLNTLP